MGPADMDTAPNSEKPARANPLLLLAISLLALALVVALALFPKQEGHEVIEEVLEGPAAESLGVYRGEIVDAVGRRDVTAVEGRRYRVRVEDESKDSAAGVARIGGLVTFVNGARKGEILVVEVTRIKRSTAEAVIVQRTEEEAGRPPEAKPARGKSSSADEVQAGRVFDVTVDDRDRKDPEHDGVAHIGGLVVFVPGTQPGDRVRIRITERRPRFAFSQVIERLEGKE